MKIKKILLFALVLLLLSGCTKKNDEVDTIKLDNKEKVKISKSRNIKNTEEKIFFTKNNSNYYSNNKCELITFGKSMKKERFIESVAQSINDGLCDLFVGSGISGV